MSSFSATRDEFVALMTWVRAGDNDAAREVVKRYGRRIRMVVRRHLSRTLRPLFDPNDFLQLVWCDFFTRGVHEQIFGREERLLRFLARVAHNKVIEHQRRHLDTAKYNRHRQCALDSPAVSEERDLVAQQPPTVEVLAAEERWQRLLRDAPPTLRQALPMLREGRSHTEVADVLGVNERTIRRTLETIRKRREAPQPVGVA